jgi:3-deoxy-D-manno-octulosonic-acid transferase
VPREEPLKAQTAPLPISLLYDGAWFLALLASSPWWLVRSLFDARFRALCRARSLGPLPPAPVAGARPRLLVHCVSVGEVKAARALLGELGREYELVLSTTTDTGAEVAAKLYPALARVRFPLDFGPCVARFLARVAPAAVILVELELWPGFLRACGRRAIPVCVVNGRISARSFPRYRRLERLLPQFARLALVCAQDEEYAARFRQLGADPARVLVTGNIKADGLRTGALEPSAEIRRLLGARPGQPLLVAGSTHAPEERWVAEAWRSAVPQARLVLVPRHPERAPAIAAELAALELRVQRLSALRGGEAPDPARPALVDTIGELEQVYALADLVFVGGSLTARGGQNMLEPAGLGRPVVYGPQLANFLQEAALLERAGASRRLAGADELGAVFRELLGDPARAQAMGRAGMRAVESQKGAGARTLAALRQNCLGALAAATPLPV